MATSYIDNYSVNSLNVILHLYFQSPHTFKADNYLGLKHALFCWVICDPLYKGRDIDKVRPQYEHLLTVNFDINYRQLLRIEELVNVIHKFLNMGEREWFDSVHAKLIYWTTLDTVSKEAIVLLILRYISKHLVHI